MRDGGGHTSKRPRIEEIEEETEEIIQEELEETEEVEIETGPVPDNDMETDAQTQDFNSMSQGSAVTSTGRQTEVQRMDIDSMSQGSSVKLKGRQLWTTAERQVIGSIFGDEIQQYISTKTVRTKRAKDKRLHHLMTGKNLIHQIYQSKR